MPSIFISYRRADSRTHAGRIHDRLAAEFGHASVFKDVDDIPDGAVFPKLLKETIKDTDVLLAIIGPKWATITDSDGNRRLHDPNDFTRMEIEEGLALETCVVIPVLVDGATMPAKSDLPESLQTLTDRNARVIRDDPDFHADMDRLIRRLRELGTKPESSAPAAAEQQKPHSTPHPREAAAQPPAPETKRSRQFRRSLQAAGAAALLVIFALGVIALIDLIDDNFGSPSFEPGVDPGSFSDVMGSLVPQPTDVAIPDYWDGSINLGVAKRFDSDECTGFASNDLYAYGPNWTYIIDNDEVEEYADASNIVISPGGTLAAVEDDGLYRLESGERLYAMGGAPKFSADGRIVASDYLGVYDVDTDRLLRNARASEEYSAISPDGRLIMSRGMGGTGAFVMDIQTGETIIADESGQGFDEAQFSDNGDMLAIAGVGVYVVPYRAFYIEGDVGTTFDSYGLFVAGGSIVVDVLAKLVLLQFDEPHRAFFTPDSNYLAVENEGVYDMKTKEMVFSLPDDRTITLSHDGRRVAVQSVGWYEIPSGEITRIDDVGENDYETPPIFSQDDNVVAFDGVGIYEVETGRRVIAYPQDFVAFAITRPLVLVESSDEDDEGCMMLADSGAFSDVEPLE